MKAYPWDLWAQHYDRAAWDLLVLWPDRQRERVPCPDRSELPALLRDLETRGALQAQPSRRRTWAARDLVARDVLKLELRPQQQVQPMHFPPTARRSVEIQSQQGPTARRSVETQSQQPNTMRDDDELDEDELDDDLDEPQTDPAVEAARRAAAISEANARAAQEIGRAHV